MPAASRSHHWENPLCNIPWKSPVEHHCCICPYWMCTICSKGRLLHLFSRSSWPSEETITSISFLGTSMPELVVDSHVAHPMIVGRHCFHDSTNDNGERLVNLCQEHNLRPAQQRFPQPRCRQWTWMHPSGSKHQLDHILINNKWVNSLRNCRAYNSVELDSDPRIVSILLATSLRTRKGKPCKRPKFNWRKLQDPTTREEFQLELSNRFQALSMTDDSTNITERYESFETAVREVAEKVVGKREPCGLPSWVSDKTIRLKTERDEAKRKYIVSKSPPVKRKMEENECQSQRFV